jgi:hypothetical protein
MLENVPFSEQHSRARVALTGLGLLLIVVELIDLPLPLLMTERTALVLLAAVGGLLCLQSSGHSEHIADPNPRTAILAGLGIAGALLVLLTLVNVLAGWGVSDRTAFLVMAVFIIVEWAVTRWDHWVREQETFDPGELTLHRGPS